MSQWKKVRIGDFLKRKRVPVVLDERTKYKLVTVRLYHKGIVLREEKLGSLIKSNMYKVSKGDFILSGIDARNGAFGIIPDELDGAIVTNDFWYFDIDESIIKREYFLWLTSTPVFLDACQKASKGETQRIRLQKEVFFDYEINCPTIEYQNDFLSKIIPVINKIEEVKKQTEQQLEYTKLLRQSILQDAIEGKLTAEWRKSHPVIKGNPDYDAEALFEKIQKEKASDKKQKELPPITDEEKPFEIPEGWKWVRLGEIVDSVVYGTSSKCSYDSNQNSAILRIPNISLGYVDDSDLKYTNLSESEKNELSLKENDLLVIRSNGSPEIVGKMVYVPKKYENFCYAGYLIRLRFTVSSIGFYIGSISNTKSLRNQIEEPLRSTVGINNINSDEIKSLMFPLPPLVEQTEIIQVISDNLKKVDQLESQIQERESMTKIFMQSIIKKAFNC